MSEYWVSTAKRYCDACKCYIGDNRASIQNHEEGKRHKENVAKRLEDIAKRGAKTHAEKTAYEKQMAKIESAALAAMQKDGKPIGEADRKRLEEVAATVAAKEEIVAGKSYYEAAKSKSSKSSTSSGIFFREPIRTPDETVGLAGGWVTVAVRDIPQEKEEPTDVSLGDIPLPTEGPRPEKRKKFAEKIVTLGEEYDNEDRKDVKEPGFKKKIRRGNARQRTSDD